jgi:hypothetical protein
MVHVTVEQNKAKEMLLESIQKANAALEQITTTQQTTQSLIQKKRERITENSSLYKSINKALQPPTTKDNPQLLEDDEEDVHPDNEHSQSETSSKFKEPTSKTLQAQLGSRSVVEKSRLDKQRDERRKKSKKSKKPKVSEVSSDDDAAEARPPAVKKKVQKAAISQAPEEEKREEDKRMENEDGDEKGNSGGGSQSPISSSDERINSNTHAAQWTQMRELMNVVQQSLEPWTQLHHQTMLSQIAATLKTFPGGSLFPSAQTLQHWKENYCVSIPLQQCIEEVNVLNGQNPKVTHQPQQQATPKSPSYDSSSPENSKIEEEIKGAPETDDRVEQPTTRSESLASPPAFLSNHSKKPSSNKQPPMTGTGEGLPLAAGKSKRGKMEITPKIGGAIVIVPTANPAVETTQKQLGQAKKPVDAKVLKKKQD